MPSVSLPCHTKKIRLPEIHLDVTLASSTGYFKEYIFEEFFTTFNTLLLFDIPITFDLKLFVARISVVFFIFDWFTQSYAYFMLCHVYLLN